MNKVKSKKADRINGALELHNSILQKNLARAVFLLAPAANMLGTGRFIIGCMKWQHAVHLEPIWETDSIIIFLPAQRTGLLTPLPNCFTLFFFSPSLGQYVLSPISFPFSL